MASDSRPGQARERGFGFVLALLALMWAVEVVDLAAGGRLDRLGIEPRDADGLPGIVAAPFLHDGFGHLIANTVPFLAMGLVIALGGLARVVAVTLVVGAVGGLGTWVAAPAGTLHVGASGLVFGYAAYLVSRGIFDRSALELGVGAVVVALWGGALAGGLLPQDGISWQGHLFGALGGVLAARLLARRRAEPAPAA